MPRVSVGDALLADLQAVSKARLGVQHGSAGAPGKSQAWAEQG
jgi:hypothetical protein